MDLAEYQDESLPRYVAISILLDTSESVRSVSLEITPGTPAESPSLPSFPQSENKARLLMYAVRLNVGATSLTERDWYDYRGDKNVCGYCKCILGKCKVTEMQSQLAAITAKINEYNEQVAELTGKVEMLQTKVDDLTGDIVVTGSVGENIYYVKYSNGRLLLRGTCATYDYDLGESPFWEDENIRTLVVSEGITAIGSSVFERCSNMATANFPNTLKSIGKREFFMYSTGGLTSLNIPASVTKIGEKAFTNISASSLVMPETLTELGTYLFMDSNTLQNVRMECAEIPAFCFVNCSRLNQSTLSRNVKKIGSHMINYCPLLREIVYEGSLDDWAKVQKMQNWDGNIGGTTDGYLNKAQCLDGYMEYDRENREWTEVHD